MKLLLYRKDLKTEHRELPLREIHKLHFYHDVQKAIETAEKICFVHYNGEDDVFRSENFSPLGRYVKEQ